MFNHMFDARRTMVHSNPFQNGLSTDKVATDGVEFAKYCDQIRTHINGLGGLSKYEQTSIAAAAVAWFPWQDDQTEHHVDSSLTTKEADKLLDDIKTTWPAMAKQAVLLSALSTTSADKLNEEEYAEFVGVAQKLDVDEKSAKKIHSVHALECRLKNEYKLLYGIK